MSSMEDGWKRILRGLQSKCENLAGYISLNVIDEPLGVVSDDTWVSPTGAVQIGEAKNFEYVGGNIVYTGVPDVLIRMDNYQALTLLGGNVARVEGAGGLNGVPCELTSQFASSGFGAEAVADNQCRFIMSTGDTLDAFVKHHEGSDKTMTMVKGVYHVQVIDVLT